MRTRTRTRTGIGEAIRGGRKLRPVRKIKKPYGEVKRTLLRLALASGGIAVALAAPKLAQHLHILNSGKAERARMYNRINTAIARLEKKCFVKVTGSYGARRVYITPEGRKELEAEKKSTYILEPQAVWDGKWRMIMFDVRERRRGVRIQLQRLLAGAGFVRLQDSVYVYPYPCDAFVVLLRSHLKSGVGELRTCVVEGLESDRFLREHFGIDC